jgi:flavin-dependent dehydrogenase
VYDAIVVGARCAGSPTAMLLARKGYRVLLVDKSTFPSDTMSSHMVWQPGIAQLKRWGLLDTVVASQCPPIRQVTFDLGAFALTGTPPPAEGVADAYAPRRKVLDTILVEAARIAGAEVREDFSVQEVLLDNDHTIGIRGHARRGTPVTEKARLIIGADGVHSLVTRTVQAPTYHTQPPLACWYYTYWSGVPTEGAEVYPRDGRFIACQPTHDGLVCITLGWTHQEFRAFRADIAGNYRKTLDLAPGLAARVDEGKQEERFVGTADVPNFFRKPYGPGWALVGDAGYHKDPVTAQGITDAFRDAEWLVEAIDAGFSGRRLLAEALADYQRRRDAAVLPMYEYTCQLARLAPPPPAMQQLFTALQGNQYETNRHFGTIAGTVPIPEFFSPENLQRIMETAGGDG